MISTESVRPLFRRGNPSHRWHESHGQATADGPEGADGPGDASTSPADASDPSADASEEAGPEQVSPKGMKVPPGALRTAKAGIRAYTEYSYKDAAHNAWLARLRKVSTPAFEHSMVEMFGNDDEGQALWYEEVVPTKRETRTEVRTAVIDDGFYTNTPNRMTFVVTFATAVRSTETGGKWTSPDDRTMWVTVVRKGARWLVDEIKSTANRS